jgi:D-alanine-D-alanine ligase
MQKFGKVAVLMGGWSAEREVSLQSGAAVLRALKEQNVDAHAVDVTRNIINDLHGFDRAFNILHGRGGEDGVIQGMLDVMQIPYTGSGVLGSSLSMDKLLTKQLWQGINLPTPAYRVLTSEQDCHQAINTLGLPLMIKPVLEGSSIGMSKVQEAKDMLAAWQLAKQSGGTIIAEQFVHGEEYTVSILSGRALPIIRLQTRREFYDYQAKYADDTETKYYCPCGLDDSEERKFAQMMLRAFDAVQAKSWGRVDFMLDEKNQPWLIEVNTVPGMTSHSLVPMAAKQAGISFADLVVEILAETLN